MLCFSFNHTVGHINLLSHVCISPTCICWKHPSVHVGCSLKVTTLSPWYGVFSYTEKKLRDAAVYDSRKVTTVQYFQSPFLGWFWTLDFLYKALLKHAGYWNDGLRSDSFPGENKFLLFSSSLWLWDMDGVWGIQSVQERNDTLAWTLHWDSSKNKSFSSF